MADSEEEGPDATARERERESEWESVKRSLGVLIKERALTQSIFGFLLFCFFHSIQLHL